MSLSKAAVESNFEPLYTWSYEHSPGKRPWNRDEYLVFGLKYNGPSCSLIRFTDFKPFFWAVAEGLSDHEVSLIAEQLASRIRRRLFAKSGSELRVPWQDYKREKDDPDCEWRRDLSGMTDAEADYYEGDYGIANKALIDIKIKRREGAEGYEPTSPTDATRRTYRFMKIRCFNEAVLREAANSLKRPFKIYHPWSNGGGLLREVKIPVFEDNMKVIKRFQYQTHLRPSSWFFLKDEGYHLVKGRKISWCKREYKASHRSIVPDKDLEPALHLHRWGIPNKDATPVLRTMVMDTEHAGKAGFPRFRNLEDHLISVGHVYVDERPTDSTKTMNKEIFVYANPDSDKFASALTNRRRSGLVRSLKTKKKIIETIARNASSDSEAYVDPQVRAMLKEMNDECLELKRERGNFDVELEAAMRQEDTFDALIDELGNDEEEDDEDEEEDDLMGGQLHDDAERSEEAIKDHAKCEAKRPKKRHKTDRDTSYNLVGAIDDVKVYMYDSVLKTYQGWMKRVNELDPDIIMTYNGDKFDWAKLYSELIMHAAEDPAKISELRMSRLRDEVCIVEDKRFNSRAKGENQYMRTKMTGRFVYDLLEYMKSTYKRKQYSLNAMLAFMRLPPKDEVSIKGINQSPKIGGDLLATVLKYCCVDCERTYQLSKKCNFTIQTLKVSYVSYSDIGDLAEGGNSKKNMNLLSYECRCNKLVINHVQGRKPPGQFRWEEKEDKSTKTMTYKCRIQAERKPSTKEEFMRWFPRNSVQWPSKTWRKKEGIYATLIKTTSLEHKAEIEKRLIERGLVLVYNGATVIDPVKGLHDCCCPTLDFNSLYPSILIAYNLCYMTIIKNVMYLSWACMKDRYTIHPITRDRVHYFVKADLYQGIVPKILIRLTSERKKVQAMMEYEADEGVKLAYNVLQLVLKVLSNALYGFQGFMFGPWPQMESAETVTYRGRTGLEETTHKVEGMDLRELLTEENWNKFVASHRKKHGWPITWYPHEEPNLEPDLREDGRKFFRPRVRPNKFDCPTVKVCPCPVELNCACVRKKHCVEATGGSLDTLNRMRKAIGELEDEVFELNPETNRFYEDRIKKACEASVDFAFVWNTYGPLCEAHELHKFLERVPELVARNPDDLRPRALVIYGDTDSVMPKCPLTTDRHGRRLAVMLGELLADIVTAIMVLGLRLAFEKVYCPVLLSKKKRYAGSKWMAPDDLDPKIETKGFQNQRRDFVPTYSSFLDTCIEAILKDRNYDNVLVKEAQLKEDIIANNITIKDFEQSKSFKGFYANDTVIQPVAAKQKLDDGFGETLAGDRIYYYIGDTGNPNHKTYQKVIEANRAMEHINNKTLPKGFKSIIDHGYYLKHFLENPYVALMTPFCGSTKAATDRFNNLVSEIETRKKKGYRSLMEMYEKDDRNLEQRDEVFDHAEIERKRKARLDRLKAESEVLKSRKRPANRRNNVKSGPKETDVAPEVKNTTRTIARRVRKPAVEENRGPMDAFVTTTRKRSREEEQ